MAGESGIVASAMVLVVEVCAEDRQTLGALLRGEDYIPIISDSAPRAIELAAQSSAFDAVLLSVSSDDLAPAEVCQGLASTAATMGAPIILIGEADSAPVPHEVRRMAFGFVRKPVDGETLLAWLRAAREVAFLRRETARGGAEGGACEAELLERFSKLSHQVNNPLQAMYAMGDLLQMKLPEGSKEREFVDKMIVQAQAAAQIVAEAAHDAKRRLGA